MTCGWAGGWTLVGVAATFGLGWIAGVGLVTRSYQSSLLRASRNAGIVGAGGRRRSSATKNTNNPSRKPPVRAITNHGLTPLGSIRCPPFVLLPPISFPPPRYFAPP